MRLFAHPLALGLAAAVSLTAAARAQSVFTDPANLRGERVVPRDGRELPIDGGPEADGRPNTALALTQLLRRIGTRASILNIVAHPDDEDGGMLTFYSRGLGARVADLSLTRGEGGQNAMTGDFEDALGLLRTQELLANDRYTGVSQMFGTEVDFGFSKTKAEAFAKWTHERVLYDAVRAIRLYRPLVITSTWTGGVTDGHGQHQVSGEIAQEAFLAAGNPAVFPELTAEGILPWQPLRMYARVPQQAISARGLYDYATNQYVPARFTNYITGVTTTTPPSTDVIVHEGQQDPLLTRAAANPTDLPHPDASLDPDTPFSYIQFARIGLGLQKSQIGPGFRVPAPGAKFDVPYHLYGSKTPPCCASLSSADATFFSGIDTSLPSIADLVPTPTPQLRAALASIAAHVASASAAVNSNPADAAPHLAEALSETDNLIAAEHDASLLHELRIKSAQFNEALSLALGLGLDATVSAAQQPTGTAAVVLAQLRTASPTPITASQFWLQNPAQSSEAPQKLTDTQFANAAARSGNNDAIPPPTPGEEAVRDLTAAHATVRSLRADARDTGIVTRPYFTRASIEIPVYTLLTPALRNAPASPPALTAWALVIYRGQQVRLGRIVHADDQPLQFVPAYSVDLPVHNQVVPLDHPQVALPVTTATALPAPQTSTLPITLTVPGQRTQTMKATVPGTTDFRITASAAGNTNAQVALNDNGARYAESFRPIGYGTLPRTNYFQPATDRIVPVDLKLPTASSGAPLRIAYLPGTGEAVPAALASINLTPTIITVADLTSAGLARFDTVVLGVRTYNAHPDLHGAATQALLDFARAGGNVLVQYQTDEFTAADAPYPLSLGNNEKVVDENAPVALLAPSLNSSPSTNFTLLTTPNRITSADFNGWIEERGHGFLSTWDPRYTALTETHDPGAASEDIAPQAPQRGGLITTALGKGRWTYCAFALYRQLPEAVLGAYRIFVNLLEP